MLLPQDNPNYKLYCPVKSKPATSEASQGSIKSALAKSSAVATPFPQPAPPFSSNYAKVGLHVLGESQTVNPGIGYEQCKQRLSNL